MPSSEGNGHGPDDGAGRVALYLRVSSEEQRDAGTIQTQAEFLEGYCELHNLEVAETYSDDGVSGTIPLNERPAGRRLLEDAREGKFATVLVYRLDRLGRALLVVVDAHDRLEARGVGLVSATEHIDTTNLSGRLHFQMLASFAEFERGSIRERTQAGLHRAYRNGKHSGIIPYGYDVGEDGRLAVVEDEASHVREVIENVAGGATLYSEAARLNALGVPGPGHKYASGPRRHSDKWTVATLSKLVHRSVYGGTHEVKSNSGKDIIAREVPAIVAPEVQEKAIARLETNRRYKHRRGDRDYLLAGLIDCAVCGSKYVGHPSHAHGKPRHYYKCNDDRPERHRKAPKGHAPYVRAGWIEDIVWSDVRRFLEDPGEVLERAREGLDGEEDTSTYRSAVRS